MILRYLLLGLIFWALTMLFPTITISGFWTIAGVIILFSALNILYQYTLGILLLPIRVLTFDFVSWLINTFVIYVLAYLFTNFTIADGSFLWTLLFTGSYTFIKGMLTPSSN